jgi:hypothetical protein
VGAVVVEWAMTIAPRAPPHSILKIRYWNGHGPLGSKVIFMKPKSNDFISHTALGTSHLTVIPWRTVRSWIPVQQLKMFENEAGYRFKN